MEWVGACNDAAGRKSPPTNTASGSRRGSSASETSLKGGFVTAQPVATVGSGSGDDEVYTTELEGEWVKTDGDDDFGSTMHFSGSSATVAADCAEEYTEFTLSEVVVTHNKMVKGNWSRPDIGSAPFQGIINRQNKLILTFPFGRYTYQRQDDLEGCVCNCG